ncbi:unnamed protein product, partial [Gongylonema pulchrum]
MLSHMLTLSGIHHGSRCLVFEQCLGLLTCAALTRLGGSGACIHLHRGNIAQSLPCIDSMDFDETIMAVFMPLRISSLLKGSVDESGDTGTAAISAASVADSGDDEGSSEQA